MMKHSVLLYGLLCVVVWTGCKSPASMLNWKGPVEQIGLSRDGNAPGKIAFVTIELSRTDTLTNTYTGRLKTYFLKEGTLRKSRGLTIQPEPYHVYAEIRSKKGELLTTIVQEDPLNTAIEYQTDENTGAMGSKVIRKVKGEVFIRFQYDERMGSISIRLAGKDLTLTRPVYYAQL